MSSPRPPGPKGGWLLGNLREFRRDTLAFLTRVARTYGDIACYRLGPRRVYLVSHPDLIEQVTVTDNRNYHKHYALRFLRPVLGNGLLTSEDDFWLRQRRLIQPAFAKARLEAYSRAMIDKTLAMLEGWRDGQVRDVHEEMMRLTLSIVAKTLLDVDIEADTSDVSQAVHVTMEDFRFRFEQAVPLPVRLPTPRNRRLKRAIVSLDAIIHRIINERRTSGKDRGDLLSTLVAARDEGDGAGMTDRQLRDEVMTLFLAGHETTAVALAWTFYLLAQNPDVARRLHKELHESLGGRAPSVADLPRLVYAERVVRESMRLYPPAYAFGRTAIREGKIAGYHVPIGQTILMSQWVVHRDARFFPEPERFRPERWGESAIEQLPKYAYFPFGGGPRACIGNAFAMMEATLVLAAVVSRFEMSLVGGHPVVPWATATLRPRHGIRVRLQDVRMRKQMEPAASAPGSAHAG
ncbi:MAG: cytochrome P450 [Planctomycetia bacterium]|nr:cytochrome P450 [Planctomycetia bacterium]